MQYKLFFTSQVLDLQGIAQPHIIASMRDYYSVQYIQIDFQSIVDLQGWRSLGETGGGEVGEESLALALDIGQRTRRPANSTRGPSSHRE